MRIIIVFSSPGFPEYKKVWQPLIDDNSGYIPLSGSGDKIYAFDGRSLLEDDDWDTNELIRIISNIINNDNNDSEYVVMLHDRTIPEALTRQFVNIRFRKYSRAGSPFYSTYIEPFKSDNKQNCFDQLWDELNKKKSAVKAPEKGTKAYAREFTKYHIIHDCDNVITCLTVQINALKKDSGSSKRNGKKIVLEYQKDYLERNYKRAIYEYNEIIKVFPDNPEINKIPGKLAKARDKYASIYRKAKKGDVISNKVIIKNWEMIIELHNETITILKRKVLKNG